MPSAPSPARTRSRHPALLAAAVVAALALPGAAAGAPTISGSDGDVWNAANPVPVYVIIGTAPGPPITWSLSEGGAQGSGPSPLTVSLGRLADGRYRLRAQQPGPGDSGQATRDFRVDTTPPTIQIRSPAPGAVVDQGQRVIASYSCDGAVVCSGSVANGAPLDTSQVGTGSLTVGAIDDAGNTATLQRSYTVRAPGAAAGQPEPPPQPIQLAPPRPGEPESASAAPRTINAGRLVPRAGARVTTRRPLLRWPAVSGARLYNVQVFRVHGSGFVKVLSAFPRGNRMLVPRGRLAFGERYAWRVWPFRARGGYASAPFAVSWFAVERPVRLSARQLLVSQRIAQAALRRVSAIDAWLNAGLVTDDLRDGGLGREAFSGAVVLSGAGAPIANGAASPRPLSVAPAPRSGSPARVRVSARQLLVNQRIAQAALRRAGALERRLREGLTGGDLRPGAVTPVKLAPGLFVASVAPDGPSAAATRTSAAPAASAGRRRPVRPTAAQALINQRIAQAAVRRANALRELLAAGLSGEHFRPGSIGADAVAPPAADAG